MEITQQTELDNVRKGESFSRLPIGATFVCGDHSKESIRKMKVLYMKVSHTEMLILHSPSDCENLLSETNGSQLVTRVSAKVVITE